MTKPIERDAIYRGRRFQTETIELCVRWYITYRLSYRDLAAMMAERRIVLSHRRSCVGSCGMYPSTKSDGIATRDRCARETID
jgi:transposase-like protein